MKYIFTWLFLWFFSSSPLLAKQLEEDELFNLSLEELMQVEVSGSTLTLNSLKKVPSAVTVFTHKQIQQMGLDSLDELMNLVPGFENYRTSSSSIGNSIFVRTDGNPANKLILIDGLRIDDIRSNSAELIMPKIPLKMIKRVEFIRGPGSAVYGSNAMLGVVNIITRSNMNELAIAYGSFSRKQAHLFSSQEVGELLIDLFAQFDLDNGDDYWLEDTFSPNIVKTDDPRQQLDFNLKLQWHKTYLQFLYHQYKTENFYELSTISNGFNARDGSIASFALKQEVSLGETDSWFLFNYKQTAVTFSAQFTAPDDLLAISEPASGDAMFGTGDFTGSNETRLQWHSNWNINTQSSLQWGLEYRHLDVPEMFGSSNFNVADFANRITPIRHYGELQTIRRQLPWPVGVN